MKGGTDEAGCFVAVFAVVRPRCVPRPRRADRARRPLRQASAAVSPPTRCRATRGRRSRSAIAGTVRTLSGERPPALRRIAIAINQRRPPRRPRPAGLPAAARSSRPRPQEALGPLRPGAGRRRQLRRRRRLSGTVGLPVATAASSPSTPSSTGKRAILAHIYGGQPIPITRIIVFRIRESQRHLRHRPHRLPAGLDSTATATSSASASACIATSPTAASGAATSAPPAPRPPVSPAPSSPSPAPR